MDKLKNIRNKPGMSNAYKYKNVKSSDFAGPNHTYPIDKASRVTAALRLLHNLPEGKQAATRARIIAIGKRKGYIGDQSSKKKK